MLGLDLPAINQLIHRVDPFNKYGRIERVQGVISVSLPAAVGELCQIRNREGKLFFAEVIGFDGKRADLMPLSTVENLQCGDEVIALNQSSQVPVGKGVLGRVLNAFGDPIDQQGPLSSVKRVRLQQNPPAALSRTDIDQVFVTGQKVVDGLLTIGRGQRIGLFAGSGVGKSTLLGQIARHATADVNVVVLVGERGREVVPFVQHSLGAEGMAKSVVVVATANESSLARVRSAETGMAIADWFRQQGLSVMLMLDSLTRYAMAQRDLGLLLGEPPTARGYTPSVFQKMAVLLERMGNSDRGSITGIITILVEGDDMNDPVADSARSILDGHIVLTRTLANAGHFPAIDVLSSNSRLFMELTDNVQQRSAMSIRQILSRYQDVVDLLQVGAYQKGVNLQTDLAIELYPKVCQFLQQELGKPFALPQTQQLMTVFNNAWTL
jgi:flagellum-specific ATP synthase